ncbi:MAG: flagellar hook-length control protein FliK [Roseomonas sp.]|nr:flagellar hook-length control protein FliK [Roseomonas sp.]
MLDAASVSQVSSTTGAAVAAKARPAEAADEGFHCRFREALETATGEETGAAAKPAENPQPDHKAQGAPQTSAQPSSTEATINSGKNPTTQVEDSTPKASNPDAEGAVSAEAAAPEVVQPLPSDVLAGLLMTQAQPKPPTPDIPALAPNTAETAADGATPGMQAPLTGAAAQVDGGADRTESQVAQQALASAKVHGSTLDQQQILAQPLQQQGGEHVLAQPAQEQALEQVLTKPAQQQVLEQVLTQPPAASGPAQTVTAQAVAAQASSKPQGLVSNPAPAPLTPAQEALEAGKPVEALSLLAKALNNTEAAAESKLAMAAEAADASWRLVSLEAPKATSAKPSAEGRAEGLSMLPQGFPATDALALRAESPLSSTPTRELATPMPARQLAPVVVSLALGRGDEALTIALDPVELGRVEVSIGQGKEAGQLRIVAERPETLALLQRDQRELDRALNQAGLGDMARSLSFSLASDQGRQQQYGAQEKGQRRASFAIGGVEGEAAMPGLPAPLRNTTSLIDIAV